MPVSFSSPSSRSAQATGAGVKAVLGPTNTGKTHLAIERMLGHSSGLIGLPLRLLAREVYNKIVERIGPEGVALVTGEEKIKPANARYWVSTVEAMPQDLDVAFVAVDEVQLGADLERGHVFTDRMLNRRGREETLVLGAHTVRPMVEKLLPGASILSRPRLSQLTHAGDRKLTRLPRRSAVVAFSADEVYAIGELIRRQRGGVAVVLGALSPRTRNAQVALYQAGDVDYLVATDAIGMGLNLDVDHVAFASDRKFDGYQFRRLNPAEFAQIAGRAGRATRDGTFGTTGRCEPFEPELVQALESHSFEPIKVFQWRNAALEFSSIGALQASLAATPALAGLTRAPVGEDILVLDHAARDEDVRSFATTPRAIERLWEVCQIPDYRKISPSAHAELVIDIFGHLMRDGVLPTDWFARQIAFADRTDGDIDTLSTRIAHIRTWTFAANRPDWLADPEHWQGVTRGIEDRLSDALHERLLQRFVDRRTSVLMRRLRENAMLETEIGKTGEVVVEGHPVGRLEGFRFTGDASAAGPEGKALRAAAQKALASEINARAARLSAAPDEQFVLASDGVIRWLGDAVAKLGGGENALKPQVRLIADEQLTGAPRETVQARLDLWITARIDKQLGPLLALEKAEDLAGMARGIAFQLVEALGVLERHRVADEVKGLDQSARSALRKHGVRFGAYHIYLPALLKPAPRALALQLWALQQGNGEPKGMDEVPQLAASGRTSFPADKNIPKALYRVVGYRVCGERAIRVDILERLADLIRPALAWRPSSPGEKPKGALDGKGFTITPAMTSLAGSSGEDFGSVLRSLGYRMERRPRPPEPPPTAPSSAAGSPPEATEGPSAVALGTAPVDPGPAAVAADGASSGPETVDGSERSAHEESPPESLEQTVPEPANGTPAHASLGAEESAEQVAAAARYDAVALGAAPAAVPDQVGELSAAKGSAEDPSTDAAAAPHPEQVAQGEPEMIEVWRPARFEERRPRRPKSERRPRTAVRDGHRDQAVADSKPDTGAAAAEPKPQDDAQDRRGANRRQGRHAKRDEARGREEGQPRHSKQGGLARPEDHGRRRERRPGGADDRHRSARGGHGTAPLSFGNDRANKGPDPDSPFAKLLALKEQLEAKAKEH